MKNSNTNETKNKTGRKPKTIYEYFNNIPEQEVSIAISKLNEKQQKLLEKAYGPDLKDKTLFRKLKQNEKSYISYIRKKLSKMLNVQENKDIKQQEKQKEKPQETPFTENSSSDVLNRTKYKKLSRNKEIQMIKKAQLSYYYSVDEDLRKKYLENFLEMFPHLKQRFEKIDGLILEREEQLKKDYSYLKKEEEIKILKNLSDALKQLLEIREELLESSIEKSKIYRERFLNNNIKLVAVFASQPKYREKSTFEDLFVEGNIGLFKALRLFDIEKGYKFSTYAIWWINKSIGIYLKKHERIIRLPVNVEDMLSKVNWAIDEIEKREEMVTPEIISKMTKIKISQVKRILEIREQLTLITSLNLKIGDDEGEIESLIPANDNTLADAENRMYNSQLLDIIDKSNLGERTLYVLKERFGLIDGRPKTFDELSKKLCISINRVRYIERIGLERLKKNDRLLRFYNGQQKENNKSKKI